MTKDYINALMGSNNPSVTNVIGHLGDNLEANGKGKRLLDFCSLIIINNFFKHNNIHMHSWENPEQT